MLELEVDLQNTAQLSSWISGLGAQIPFAESKALNLTANSAQKAVQDSLDTHFRLRRAAFDKATIYRKPGEDFAKKDNLVAVVRVNPDRDIFAKFEDGGMKRSLSGKALAVPIVRIAQPDLIIGRSDPLSVRMLMASISQGHGKMLKATVRKGLLRVKTVGTGVFLLKSRSGQTLIAQRPTAGQGSKVQILYAFERDVPIDNRLHFEDIAMAAALEHWEDNMNDALDFAIATMR